MKNKKPSIIAITIAMVVNAQAMAQEAERMPLFQDRSADVQPVLLDVHSNLVFEGENTSASVQGDFIAGSMLEANWGFPTTWQAFTLASPATVTIDLAGTRAEQPGAFADFLVVGPNAGGAVIEASAVYLSAAGDGNYAMTFVALAPGTYYIPLGYIPGVSEGHYSVEVSADPHPGDVVTD